MENTHGLRGAIPAEASRGREERVRELTGICAEDLLSAFGVDGSGRVQTVLKSLASVPARRLAREISTYDELVGRAGLPAAGSWMLGRMSREAIFRGAGEISREGPLLVAANHPGLTDAVALFAAIPREDLRVIAAERPFLAALPNTSRALIPVPPDAGGRSSAIRGAARHMRSGGAVLTFPGGRIEPDPAVMPGAAEALGAWHGSVDLFARLVPGLVVVPAVVSGVISRDALKNPITRIRGTPRDREWLAATLQVLVPALRDVTTRVEFGVPIRPAGEDPVGPQVVEAARRIIEAVRPG